MQHDREVEFTPGAGMGGDVEFRAGSGLNVDGAATEAQAQVRDTVSQAKDKAQQLVEQAQQRAGEQVESTLESQKARAASALGNVASSLRSSSQQFSGELEGASRVIRQAADQVDRMAGYLEQRDVRELMHEVEGFARRQPALFLTGAFAAGLLGARFLKSSRDNLVREGVRDHWSPEALTSRVDDPERDAVGRPGAPGYEPPSERASQERKSAGPRER